MIEQKPAAHWCQTEYHFRHPDGLSVTLGRVAKNKKNPDEWLSLARAHAHADFYPIDAHKSEQAAREMVEVYFRHWPPSFEPTPADALAENARLQAALTAAEGRILELEQRVEEDGEIMRAMNKGASESVAQLRASNEERGKLVGKLADIVAAQQKRLTAIADAVRGQEQMLADVAEHESLRGGGEWVADEHGNEVFHGHKNHAEAFLALIGQVQALAEGVEHGN